MDVELVEAPCPDCTTVNGDAEGCEVCEGTGRVKRLRPVTPEGTPEERPSQGSGKDIEDTTTVMRGGLTARELGLRSAAARQAKKQLEQAGGLSEADGTVKLVRVSVATGDIVKRLQQDARAGSTGAARELRSWLADAAEEKQTDVSDLDERTRQRLLARLLLELEDAEEGRLYRWEGGSLVLCDME